MRTLSCAALLLALAAATPARAQLEDLSLPQRMTAFGRTLELAGCAQRETLWMEPYAVSLYLPNPRAARADRLLEAGVPKIVRLDVTYEGSVPDDIPEGWAERLRRELSSELYRVVQRLYSGLTSGDTVVFAYAPEEGTTVTVNGRVVKRTGDDRLIRALLSMFVGSDPVSANMKRLLLQGRC